MTKKIKRTCLKNKSGVTAMEAIIGVALVSMVVMSLYSALGGTISNVNEAKVRLGGVAIANEKMEVIRNLSYDQIGTVGGVVSGPLYQEETVEKNGRVYQVETEIRYIDDDFDGFFPDDLVNTDYKKAQVSVTLPDNSETVELFSIFVPNGIETNEGGGTLSVNVLNSGSDPVAGATVELVDLDNDPDIDNVSYADASGNLILPGVPSQNYRITVSKSGYETSRTYPNPPEGSFTPIINDLNLIEGNLNTKNFIIDEAGDLTLEAVNLADETGISGVDFDLIGGKQIGFDPDTYILESTETTDSNGEVILNNASPGEYQITNMDSLSTDQYLYLGSSESIPFNLDSLETKIITFLFADKSVDSIAFNIIDGSESLPLEGASVHLAGEEFDETVVTGSSGIAFFPSVAESMNAGDYSYSVTKDGYSSGNGIVNISNLVQEEVTINPQ